MHKSIVTAKAVNVSFLKGSVVCCIHVCVNACVHVCTDCMCLTAYSTSTHWMLLVALVNFPWFTVATMQLSNPDVPTPHVHAVQIAQYIHQFMVKLMYNSHCMH